MGFKMKSYSPIFFIHDFEILNHIFNSRSAPLINGANKGRSAEEIKEVLQKCTDYNLRLEKYSQSLDSGRSQAKKNRMEIHNLINESLALIQKSKVPLLPNL